MLQKGQLSIIQIHLEHRLHMWCHPGQYYKGTEGGTPPPNKTYDLGKTRCVLISASVEQLPNCPMLVTKYENKAYICVIYCFIT